jgi:hypothetical protein
VQNVWVIFCPTKQEETDELDRLLAERDQKLEGLLAYIDGDRLNEVFSSWAEVTANGLSDPVSSSPFRA